MCRNLFTGTEPFGPDELLVLPRTSLCFVLRTSTLANPAASDEVQFSVTTSCTYSPGDECLHRKFVAAEVLCN
jgi:hypothetical protein